MIEGATTLARFTKRLLCLCPRASFMSHNPRDSGHKQGSSEENSQAQTATTRIRDRQGDFTTFLSLLLLYLLIRGTGTPSFQKRKFTCFAGWKFFYFQNVSVERLATLFITQCPSIVVIQTASLYRIINENDAAHRATIVEGVVGLGCVYSPHL